MKELPKKIIVVSIIALASLHLSSISAFANDNNSVFEIDLRDAPQSIPLGIKDNEGRDLYGTPVVIQKFSDGSQHVAPYREESTGSHVYFAPTGSLILSNTQLVSLNVGVIIGDGKDITRTQGLMVQSGIGFGGISGAFGFASTDYDDGFGYGIFIGPEVYHAYSNFGLAGTKGETYVGGRLDLSAGLKMTLGILAKTSGGSGSDILVNFGFGVGIP